MQGVLLAGRFRITDRLGVGGMGEVWSAHDERMRRDVAVKVVHALFGGHEAETRARFRREVQLAGRITHQNVVTIHDWGEVAAGGRQALYLVMERVPGISLSRRLKESTPPWPLAVGWAVQIAQALDAAHGKDVVHRDIKPANVLLTPEGTVKVLDFGVAKFLGDTMSVNELTVTGTVLGTPHYMSPEQAAGVREIDHRSDLYSLGCLLYHAVTGQPPFAGSNQLAVLRMHAGTVPKAPAALVEGLPDALNDLILSLIAKRPEDRPADAVAVHDALSAILVDHALTPSGGDILDAARPGLAASVAGRILHQAWRLWERAETHSAARREEADVVVATARAEAEHLRSASAAMMAEADAARRRAAELQQAAERRVVEAETALREARAEADRLVAEARTHTVRSPAER
ncbi:protein kinase [Streptomyces sp. NPDC051315]|uniref:serine/threonine-protein kinase n=1 Tax=Streptomyces sp. NPDC051315 TaxID=3365650 RepID=UPI0037B9DF0A